MIGYSLLRNKKMVEAKKTKKGERNFYEDLSYFVVDWMEKHQKDKKPVRMSEIIGGLEMAKVDFHNTFLFEKRISEKKGEIALDMFNRFFEKFEGKTIEIGKDKSLRIWETEEHGK